MTTDIQTIMTAPIGRVDITKSSQAALTDKLVEYVREGETYALDTLAKLTWLQGAIEDAIKQIRPVATEKAADYGTKTFAAYGVDWEVKEIGVKYDFTDDKDWQLYEDTIHEARALQKGRESVLKAMKLAPRTSTTAVVAKLRKV